MSRTDVDTIIVGQGLAGTALGWCLWWRGLRVLVIDRPRPDSASRVAAGLITPVTGQRLTVTWRLERFWPAAVAFYRRVEAETKARFFFQRPMLRLFADRREKERFGHRMAGDDFASLVSPPDPPVDEVSFDNPLGGFQMPRGGQLDVPRYLDESRRRFAEARSYLSGWIDPKWDVRLEAGTVALPRLGVSARRLIFCQGIEATDNPWFAGVRFDAAKGEILTVGVPGLREQRVVHRGVWLAPLGDCRFLVGATYGRDRLDAVATDAGREELCSRLRAFLRRPFTIEDHTAGVRPVVTGRHPVLGIHPAYPQLGYFNGLASKGTLQAPWLASHFADCLEDRGPVDPEVDVTRRAELRP